jgi:outer membrane receptor protein involved in Fe transport
VEGDAEYRLGKVLDLRLSGDFTDARVDGGDLAPQLTGKRPAQAPRLTLTAGGDWNITSTLSLSADVRYEDVRYADDQNTLVLPPGALVFLHLDWQATRHVGLFVAVDNVTDTALATDQTADRVRVYDEPRVFRFGLRFRG